MGKTEQTLEELWHNIKHVTEVADEDRKNVAEEMFGKIMAANFPKSVKGKKTTEPGSSENPKQNEHRGKNTPRHFMVKLLKTRDGENMTSSQRETKEQK